MRVNLKGRRVWHKGGSPGPRAAFSLVELLVVLAILLLVVFMSRDGYLRDRDRKRMQACARNLAGQYVALQMYANDHEGWFPLVTNAVSPAEPLSLLIPRYTTQTEFWICPAAGDKALKPAQSFAGRKISYAYYMGWRGDAPAGSILVSDEQVDAGAKIAQQLLFSADGHRPGNNHGAGGGNFLRTDGSQGFSPSHAVQDFPRPAHVTLLNPTRP